MRSSLAPWRGQRVPVVARFSGLSRAGYAILEELETPAGRIPHAWVQWPGRLPMPGDRVRFEAEVRPYYSEHRQEFDLGFRELEVHP